MSHSSFEAMETTLRQLSEIVERNHAQQTEETCLLVNQMTKLVDEMKSKTRKNLSSFPQPPASVSSAVAVATK